MSRFEGVLPVDKPEGPTSHDVVARARRALGERRIGHTGTLDPFASGLLLLCVGRATRIAEYLSGLPKSYRATLRLGVSTDTDDRTGEVVARADAAHVSEADLRAALGAQTGEILQRPPVYSAKKVAGERMYAAARRGDAVQAEPVRVRVHRLELLRYDPPDAEVEVEVSSGTYIRAIARDVGEAVGVGAHLTALRRTRVGEHSVDSALHAEELDERDAVAEAIIPPARALAHLPHLEVDEDTARRVGHGGAFTAPPSTPRGLLALVTAADELVAIAESDGARVQPRKVLA